MAKYNTSLRMNVTDDMTNENDQTGEVTNKKQQARTLTQLTRNNMW